MHLLGAGHRQRVVVLGSGQHVRPFTSISAVLARIGRGRSIRTEVLGSASSCTSRSHRSRGNSGMSLDPIPRIPLPDFRPNSWASGVSRSGSWPTSFRVFSVILWSCSIPYDHFRLSSEPSN
jgi:hypothetical protein